MKIFDKSRLKNLVSLILFGIIIIPVTSFGLGNLSTGWRVTTVNKTVDVHATCKKVKRTSGSDLFIPTKTSGEWSSFRSHVPSGVTVSDCTPACSGVLIGGYCWYQSGNQKSCTQACATHGGCNLAGTRNYVGSGGSYANCLAVATALGYNLGGGIYRTDNYNGWGDGCNYYHSNSWNRTSLLRSASPATTCEFKYTGSYGYENRICACNN